MTGIWVKKKAKYMRSRRRVHFNDSGPTDVWMARCGAVLSFDEGAMTEVNVGEE